jgi:hypothetical protein
MTKGILVAILHCAIVLSLAGKYELDRQRLPRVWVKCARYDPNLPIRGRYISIRLLVDANDTRFPDHAALSQPLAYFIPEHAADPTMTGAGEYWVEVTVPPEGPPRPIRLAEKPLP